MALAPLDVYLLHIETDDLIATGRYGLCGILKDVHIRHDVLLKRCARGGDARHEQPTAYRRRPATRQTNYLELRRSSAPFSRIPAGGPKAWGQSCTPDAQRAPYAPSRRCVLPEAQES